MIIWRCDRHPGQTATGLKQPACNVCGRTMSADSMTVRARGRHGGDIAGALDAAIAAWKQELRDLAAANTRPAIEEPALETEYTDVTEPSGSADPPD